MHREPDSVPTMIFDWGSIKWHVTPGSVPGASSTLGEVVINPNKGHDRHEHPFSDEILYIVEGEGRQTVGDGPEFAVKAGDAVWIPMGRCIRRSTRGGGRCGSSPRTRRVAPRTRCVIFPASWNWRRASTRRGP